MKRRITALGEEPQAEHYTATNSDTTKHDTATDTADSLFAKALTNLSFNDRSEIEDEIHGVSCMAIEETSDLLEHSLIEFESEIHKINPKPAYDKAQVLLLASSATSNNCYINDKSFRLRFLRCELFHVRKAAERYIKYLDFVADVYGEYALQRPIRMSDFTRKEMAYLREGQNQILPFRDRSGRRIIFKQKRKEVSLQTLLRVEFYVLNACVGGCDTSNNDFNNIECHRKGVIIVAYFPGKINLRRTHISAEGMIAQIVPILVVCIHLCLPSKQVYRVTGKLIGMALSALNSRTKIHLGNPASTDTRNIKRDNLKQWIKLIAYTEKLTQEQMTKTLTSSTETMMKTPMHSIVECPGSNDVIFRKGKSMNYHPGNIKFQNIIESKLQQHSNLNTTELQFTLMSMVVPIIIILPYDYKN